MDSVGLIKEGILILGIINGRIILEDKILDNSALVLENGIIKDIVDGDSDCLKTMELLDVGGKYISPGFIDLHIHGSRGTDVMDGTFDSVNNIAKAICEYGVTSFLGTTMSMPKNSIINALDNIKSNMGRFEGARLLGVHLEGPFINKTYKGAQSAEHIVEPDYEMIEPYIDIIKLITLAPEIEGGMEFIDRLKTETNMVISMGHTGATFEEAMEGIDRGVGYSTHTFNGMTPLHHRKPGAVGAILSSNIYSELIADTIHVHKGLFQMFMDVKTKEKVILVTDCVMAGCLQQGEYELGGQKIIVDENSSRLEDGTLAGSILTLNKAIKNIAKHTKYELNDIVRLASLNPAKVLGIDDVCGSIDKGKKADIAIFDDEYNVHMTLIDGNIVYRI